MALYKLAKSIAPVRFKEAGKVLFGTNATSGESASWFQSAGQQIHDRGHFVGCPLPVFETTSKDLFCLALLEGLRPASSVLEVGCGCLRSGYLFIWHQEAGLYCGIEPNVAQLNAGRELLLGTLEADKSPRFSHNDDFRFGQFGTSFDFVVAFSVWSHASKGQIKTMLDQFKASANPGAKFLTSWVPSLEPNADYQGEGWIGRSHQSDKPGIVSHSRSWIDQAAASRGLKLRFFNGFTTLNQQWLILSRQ